MFGFKFLYFIILTLNLNKSNGQISDKRLCVDEKCQEPVSLARTLLTYSSPDSRILSFPVNAEVKIFSKEAGSRADLWGAEINGKRGYVPKKYVRELKMYNVPTLLVDTDFKDSSEVPSVKLMVQPDSVKQPYEVIVGTTVYKVETMDHSTSGTPSLTEEPVSDAKLDNEHKEGGVQGVLSSIKSWVSEGIESAMKDNGEDVMDEDDDDFEIDDEDEDTAVDKVITNSEFSKKESQSATNDLKEKFENQMILKVQDDSIRSLKETIEKQKLPEVPVDTQILGEDINPEIIDSEDNGTKLEKKENKQPAQSDYVLDRKEEHTDKQEQIEIAKATNENKATKSTDQSTTSLVNANMEVTTPSFFLDSIAPSSIFKEAVAQNPLENSQESQVSNIPDKDHKSAEVHSTLTDQESKNEGANTVFPDEMNTKTIESKEKIEKSSTEGETTPGNVSPSIDKLEKLGEIENKEFTLDQNLNNKVDKSGEIIHLVQIEPETSQESQDTEEPPQLSPLGGLFIAFKSSHDVVKDLNDNTLDSSESKHVNEPSNSFGSDTSDISHTTEDTYSHVNTDQTVGSGLSILGTRHLLSDDKSKQGSQEVLSDNKLAEENNDIESKDADTSTVNNDGTDVISSNNLSSKNEKETDKEKDDTEQNIPGMQENIKKENKNDHITENTKIPHQEKVMDIGKMGDNRVEQEILTLQDEVKEDSVTKSRDSSENLPEESSGFFVTFMSWFGMCDSKTETQLETYNHPQSKAEEILENACENQPHKDTNLDHCDANSYSYFNFNSDMFLYLVTSAISCIMFLVIYMAFDRSKKEAPLIARINKLEKELLVALKENEMLQDKNGATEVPEEVIEEFKNQLSEMQATRDHIKLQVMELEMQIKKKDEQIESLEKELETSTEVGMELNRIISEMLDPTNGNDRLKENFDQLQRQLLEQKDTISTMTQSLTAKVADNTRLQTELEASQKIAADAQEQLNKLLEKMIQLEKDKDSQCSMFQGEMGVLQRKVEESVNREEEFTKEIQIMRNCITHLFQSVFCWYICQLKLDPSITWKVLLGF
ncbi:unnamed protein product [Acanthoscelides obtectus]|uniref:SH3 domain-containing protein n=1 Tax=Acanthoscelides obtectus TaxID=200917 RepID=A0A9P0M430_ACAOB|nr:unnamed protein product [Acanthoscelides obtectus]CAK1623102.1 Transport and Golgi organization protein 1 [Acanthoscelides obtectus]